MKGELFIYTTAKLQVSLIKPVIALVSKPIPVLFTGAGKILEVPALLKLNGVTRALIVTDKSLVSLGLLAPFLARMEESGVRYVVYDDIQPDPTYTTASNGLALCKENKCDGIVAVGGGSVLDTAKAISVATTNGKLPQALAGQFKVKKPGLTLIAVPTTAGTGSEATLAAVLSDPVTHRKSTIVDPKIVPGIAVLDPALTVGLPPHITAATAMDALTHAVEAYVSGYATDETRGYSRICIKLIYENLMQVCKTPADLAAREALLLASFYGGMAFTRTYVGYVHAFAHNVGGKCGIPHGLANAVLLPPVMRSYLPECTEQFAELAKMLGLASKESPEVAANRFVESLEQMNRAVGIPQILEKFPVSRVEEMRKLAFKECHGTYPVPKYLTAAKADEILSGIAKKD